MSFGLRSFCLYSCRSCGRCCCGGSSRGCCFCACVSAWACCCSCCRCCCTCAVCGLLGSAAQLTDPLLVCRCLLPAALSGCTARAAAAAAEQSSRWLEAALEWLSWLGSLLWCGVCARALGAGVLQARWCESEVVHAPSFSKSDAAKEKGVEGQPAHECRSVTEEHLLRVEGESGRDVREEQHGPLLLHRLGVAEDTRSQGWCCWCVGPGGPCCRLLRARVRCCRCCCSYCCSCCKLPGCFTV